MMSPMQQQQQQQQGAQSQANGNSSLVGLLHSNPTGQQSSADQAQPSPYQAPARSPAGSQLNGNIMSPTPSQVNIRIKLN